MRILPKSISPSLAPLMVVILLFAVLLVPDTFQQGMFLDGLSYAAISKNMAHGLGTLWEPHYTQTLYPSFYEHPPLALFLQSLFFRCFGDSFLVEKIYGLITAVITLSACAKTWKLLNLEESDQKYYWLPLFLILLVPVVSWSFKNNMLENTLIVFTMFSSYYLLKSLVQMRWSYLIPTAIFLVCALLTKGFVGLFPMMIPVLYFTFVKRKKFVVVYFLGFLTLFFLFVSALVMLFPEAKVNFVRYLNAQVLPTLKNERIVSKGSRLLILVKLFFEMLVPILLFAILSFFRWKKEGSFQFIKNKFALLAFAIGVSASFPLIISQKQSNYYLLPSIPFFAIALSLWILPQVKIGFSKISLRIANIMVLFSLMALSIVIVLSGSQLGAKVRNHELIEDVNTITRMIEPNQVLSTNEGLAMDWTFIAYMNRIGGFSLDYKTEHDYMLLEKGAVVDSASYYVIESLNHFQLLKRKTAFSKD